MKGCFVFSHWVRWHSSVMKCGLSKPMTYGRCHLANGFSIGRYVPRKAAFLAIKGVVNHSLPQRLLRHGQQSAKSEDGRETLADAFISAVGVRSFDHPSLRCRLRCFRCLRCFRAWHGGGGGPGCGGGGEELGGGFGLDFGDEFLGDIHDFGHLIVQEGVEDFFGLGLASGGEVGLDGGANLIDDGAVLTGFELPPDVADEGAVFGVLIDEEAELMEEVGGGEVALGIDGGGQAGDADEEGDEGGDVGAVKAPPQDAEMRGVAGVWHGDVGGDAAAGAAPGEAVADGAGIATADGGAGEGGGAEGVGLAGDGVLQGFFVAGEVEGFGDVPTAEPGLAAGVGVKAALEELA